MVKQLKLVMSFGLSFFLFGSLVSKENLLVSEMTLHDFMEDYTRPASKLMKNSGDSIPLVKILESVPEMAPPADKVRWKEIVDEKLASGKPEESCKACHTEFKKEYKAQYRKRLIPISEDLKALSKFWSKPK